MDSGLFIFITLVILYSLFAYKLGRVSITMPMVFVLAGALIWASGLNSTSFSLSNQQVEQLVEITLSLLLFADAATLDFKRVQEDARLPARLLGIGLPLTVVLGALAAMPLFGRGNIGLALLVAAILAPTDAALGLPIFNNPRVPVRIRRALNVESGLNDGLATPLVNLFLALSLEELSNQSGWLTNAALEIAIGVGVGAALGAAGGWLFTLAVRRDWATHISRQIGNLALALLVFFASKALGGNAFVAVFIAGLFFGFATRHTLHDASEFTEVIGTTLSLFVWTLFGAVLVIPLFTSFNPLALLYALVSLTIIRMLPVAVSLKGLRLRNDTTLMMGWLGPRGLASVVFLILTIEAAHEAQADISLLVQMAAWTILLSVLLHGATALPLANWYARRLESASPDSPELLDVPELPAIRRKPLTLPHHLSDHPAGGKGA